jgi:hypothetical protein
MKYICALALLMTAVSTAGTLDDILASASEIVQQEETEVTSDVEVIELLRTESPEELESALVDGYPMPWLEEILNDESIPEEDRYWLDCRMRAHIARHLHRFYDRDGNPVEMEAEWIVAGEHYWREHMMVNPVGEDYAMATIPDNLPKFTGEPGTIVNLYGEQTGEMALTQRGIIMSRDGTIGVLKTGRGDPLHPGAPNYACLLYSDGSFNEIEIDLVDSYDNINVSWDGELVVVCCKNTDQNQPNGYLQAFDHYGNTLYTTEIAGTASARPAISPDNRYIAVPLLSPIPRSIVILDAQTGELLRRFPDLWVREVLFSPDAERCGFTAASICQISLESDHNSWNCSSIISGIPGSENYFTGSSLSNNPDIVAVSGKQRKQETGGFPFTFYSELLGDDVVIYRSEASNLDLSPNGCFAFGFNSRRALGTDYEPSLVTVVSIRERG